MLADKSSDSFVAEALKQSLAKLKETLGGTSPGRFPTHSGGTLIGGAGLTKALMSQGEAILPKSHAAAFCDIPVHESPLFPYEFNCRACDGTGEGQDSTYCSRCGGAGAVRVEGMMTATVTTSLFSNDAVALPSATLITSKLPRKFDPYFPKGLVPPMPMKGPVV